MGERGETKEKFVEEGEKKRRRTGEKRYKPVKKKVDGQRKRKPEKSSAKGKIRYRKRQMARSRGKKRKEKGKSYRGNNNRGEIGD
jgi:hypothetical protein